MVLGSQIIFTWFKRLLKLLVEPNWANKKVSRPNWTKLWSRQDTCSKSFTKFIPYFDTTKIIFKFDESLRRSRLACHGSFAKLFELGFWLRKISISWNFLILISYFLFSDFFAMNVVQTSIFYDEILSSKMRQISWSDGYIQFEHKEFKVTQTNAKVQKIR